MRITLLAFLCAISYTKVYSTNYEVDDDEEYDAIQDIKPEPPTRVAWVPIMSRNMSTQIEQVIEAEKGSEEKLERIGKMLEDSYNKIQRDVEEGDIRIKELAEKQKSANSAPKITLFTVLFSLFSVRFVV